MIKIIDVKENQPFEYRGKTQFASVVTSLVNEMDGISQVFVVATCHGFSGRVLKDLEAYSEELAMQVVKDEKLIQLACQELILNISNIESALNSIVEKGKP